jgi:low temperature requirement protein LtrA
MTGAQPAAARAKEPQEKRVTWAELFFDLVFVFAVTEVSTLLHEDHSWSGILRALVVFVPIWWGWVGTSVHANTHDVDNPVDRIGIFAVGLASLFMAMATPYAYENRGLLFGLSYLALRIVLAALVFRGPRMTVNAFSVGLLVTGPLLTIGGLVHDENVRLAIWGLAALVDLATPRLTRRRLALIHFEPSHLPERFGLFLIIALGESIVGIGLRAANDLNPARGFAVAAAFVLACALWWVYFVFAAGAVRHAVATAAIQTDIIRPVLAYGHLAFVGAIIAVAVGLAEVVTDPLHHLHGGGAGLLYGGTALYLVTFGYTRWRMFHTLSVPRLTTAALVLVLLPVALFAPALAALAVLAAVVSGLNAFEYAAVRRTRKARSEEVPAPEPAAVPLSE